jgi:hypothetical protein
VDQFQSWDPPCAHANAQPPQRSLDATSRRANQETRCMAVAVLRRWLIATGDSMTTISEGALVARLRRYHRGQMEQFHVTTNERFAFDLGYCTRRRATVLQPAVNGRESSS